MRREQTERRSPEWKRSARRDPDRLEKKDFLVLSDLGRIRALAQKERLEILRLLAGEARTGAQVAEHLGIPANRAHYHIRRLLSAGLVLEVGRGRKRWKEERFFRAAAGHFLIDPALALNDADTSSDLLRSAEHAFMNWRRREVLSLDLGVLARQIVVSCLRIRPGEEVLVLFGPPTLELAEAVQVELARAGARPMLKIWSLDVVKRTLSAHTEESLAALPFLPAEIDARLNAVMHLASAVPEGPAPAPELLQRLPLLFQSVSRWQQSLRERRVRHLEVVLPHRAAFAGGDVSEEEALDLYWRCLATQYETLEPRARRILERMEGRSRLLLEDERGTRLAVEIDRSRPQIRDGVFSPEDVSCGRTSETLPTGTLSFLPIASACEGTFVADSAFVSGVHARGIHVTVRQGRIVRLLAEKGGAELKERLRSSVGDADLIAEIGIGLNRPGSESRPALLTGMPVLDACQEGVVAVAFGDNEILGGDVRSTLSLVLPSTRCSLRLVGDAPGQRRSGPGREEHAPAREEDVLVRAGRVEIE